MATKLITPPAVEPVSLDEAKHHLKLDTSPATEHPDDDLIEAMIKAARRYVEGRTGRALITQTRDLYLDGFPFHNYDGPGLMNPARYIQIPDAPLQSLVFMEYETTSGSTVTVSFLDPSGTAQLVTSDYLVDVASEPGRLVLRHNKIWPARFREPNSVRIRFICGFGDAGSDVPEDITQAVLLKIADLYENRGDVSGDARLSGTVDALLAPYKVFTL